MTTEVHPYKLASVVLQYPTVALFEGMDHLNTVVATYPKAVRKSLARFLSWLCSTPPEQVARHYVDTFDLQRRSALYLTYYRYGDTRKRGMAILAFKNAFQSAGFEATDADLPDYLPLVLDFAALTPRGEALLRAHRADLELLRRALHQADTPYAYVVDAVCASLPKPGPRDLALIREFWGKEPPNEEVGLQPFAPPGYLSGEGAHP